MRVALEAGDVAGVVVVHHDVVIAPKGLLDVVVLASVGLADSGGDQRMGVGADADVAVDQVHAVSGHAGILFRVWSWHHRRDGTSVKGLTQKFPYPTSLGGCAIAAEGGSFSGSWADRSKRQDRRALLSRMQAMPSPSCFRVPPTSRPPCTGRH